MVDNQATANTMNRKAACKNSFFKPVIRRCINMQGEFVKTGWMVPKQPHNTFGTPVFNGIIDNGLGGDEGLVAC